MKEPCAPSTIAPPNLELAVERITVARAHAAQLLAEVERQTRSTHSKLDEVETLAQRAAGHRKALVTQARADAYAPGIEVLASLSELRRHALALDDHLARQMSLLASMLTHSRDTDS